MSKRTTRFLLFLGINGVSILNESSRIIVVQHFSRNACDGSIFRDIFRYNSPSSNRRVATDFHILYDADIWTNIDVVADDGRGSVVSSDVQELGYVDIVAYNGSLAHHHTNVVADIKPVSNFC